MNPEITVYSFRRCPFAMRVRMVLHEKGIPFKTIEEDLKNFSPELKKLHPEACVPLLLHGDQVIYESAIITEYLDDAFPDKKLMPESAIHKMEVRRWTYWCNHIFKHEIDRFKYGKGRGLSDEEIQKSEETLQGHLNQLEARLSKAEWLVGDHLSLADIHVFPFYRQLARVAPPHPSIAKNQATAAWLERLTSRPTFEKTMAK